MKTVIDYLQQKNCIFKSFTQIQPKAIGSRKKIELYVGVDLKGFYVLVMSLEKKSRILSKEAKELIELHTRVERYIDSAIKKKYIIIKAPLCSKAKASLVAQGWRVWHE